MSDLTFFKKYEDIYNRYLKAVSSLDEIGNKANKLTSTFENNYTLYTMAESLWDYCIQQHTDICFRTGDLGLYLNRAYHDMNNKGISDKSRELIIETANKLNIEEVTFVVQQASTKLDYLNRQFN